MRSRSCDEGNITVKHKDLKFARACLGESAVGGRSRHAARVFRMNSEDELAGLTTKVVQVAYWEFSLVL